MSADRAARRNLALFPWYVAGIAAFAWMPIFFLYLTARVSLSEALALEALYYAAVVALELPSGYFSDRVGRRATLILAAASLVGAYVVFAASDGFWALALAQVALAAGLAFNSGTDTSFHLASLEAASLGDQYGAREARLESLSLGVGAAAALIGGGLGLFDLRLAYAASALAALVALGAALSFLAVDETAKASDSFGLTLRTCLDLARRDPRLGWLFALSVAATVINHVPYEFYQPYLDLLEGAALPSDLTPLIAGAHLALVQIVAVPAAAFSQRLADRLGLVRHLLLSVGLQVGLVGLMALFVHPVVAFVLLGRSIPRALQSAPMRAAIAPHVRPQMRATYLSLQSLVGRLGFSALLLLLSLMASDDLSALLQVGAVASATLLFALLALAAKCAPRLDDIDGPG